MRGFRAKALMKWARFERANEQGVVERDLVQKKSGSVVHSPHSMRSFYLRLKRNFKIWVTFSRGADERKEMMERLAGERKSTTHRARRRKPAAGQGRLPDRIATIRDPLSYILSKCPHYESQSTKGLMLAHPTYRKARLAADRGHGDRVMRIAMSLT